MKKIISKKWKKINKFEEINALRIDKLFCDITLQSVDGLEINAHRNVLYAGSNYFKGLFTLGMKDSNAKVLKLHMKGKCLEKVISFVYIGEIEIDESDSEEIEQIAQCANYFQIQELIEECIGSLSDSIDDENCLRYWRLAQECFSDEFENICISYIALSAERLFGKEPFVNELQMDQLKTLLKTDEVQCSEEMKFKTILSWTKCKTDSDIEFSSTFMELLNFINFTAFSKKFVFCYILDKLAKYIDVIQKISEMAEKSYIKLEKRPFSASFTEKKNLLALFPDEMKVVSNKGKTKIFHLGETNLVWRGYGTYNNFLLASGGRRNKTYERSALCETFNPTTKQWRTLPSLNKARYYHETVLCSNTIFACGGYNKAELSEVEIFDIGQEKWIPGPPMNVGRFDFGLVSLNRSLYALGGNGDAVEMFDPRVAEWNEICRNSELNECVKCVSSGTDIYCFRSGEKPIIFDIKMNQLREWEGDRNYKSTKLFKVCNLDKFIYVIQSDAKKYYDVYKSDGNKCYDFYKFDLKGNLIISKEKFLETNERIEALVALNYEKETKRHKRSYFNTEVKHPKKINI